MKKAVIYLGGGPVLSGEKLLVIEYEKVLINYRLDFYIKDGIVASFGSEYSFSEINE